MSLSIYGPLPIDPDQSRVDIAVPQDLAEGLKILAEFSSLIATKDRSVFQGFIKRLKASKGISDEILSIITDTEFQRILSESNVN